MSNNRKSSNRKQIKKTSYEVSYAVYNDGSERKTIKVTEDTKPTNNEESAE